MNKRLIFSIITLTLCVALLIGAFVALPKPSHAVAPQSHTASTPITATISVSPLTLPNSQCVPLAPYTPYGYLYQSCSVTVTLNQSVPKGLHWKSSYTSKSCYYTCGSYNSFFTVFQGSGTLFNQGDTAQVYIICPIYNGSWYHGGLNATFVFSGPANKVTVNYSISGGN